MNCVGIDIIEIGRIEKAIARWGERFLGRVYTERELELCRRRVPALAARFAAKEAVMKALGTGTLGMDWRDVEILADPAGKPIVNLHGRARSRASRSGLAQLAISLAHSREYALACATGLHEEATPGII